MALLPFIGSTLHINSLFYGLVVNIKRLLFFLFISMGYVFLSFADSSAQELPKSLVKTFYVATNGNDQWSGAFPMPGSSSEDGPFATLQRARNAIRELKQKGSTDAFTVLVRGGMYQLNETFILGSEDSGTEANPLVIRAFDNEHPVLTGTRKIYNFEPYKGKIYKTNLTGIVSNLSTFRQLFASGKRQVLARYPNFDLINPVGGGFLNVESPVTEGSKRAFRYQGGTIPEWSGQQNAELFIFPGNNWTNNILPILGIDKNARTVTLAQDTSHELKSGNRYFFQNLLEELDSPGEWYFDRLGKVLYYWPLDDTSLKEVTIPLLKSILTINSTGAYIRFEGFTLEGCEGSAIVVNGAKKTVLSGNTIYNIGSNGIEIQGGFENAAIGNDIYEVGGTGIIISGGDSKTLTPASNRAENNYIHNTGVFSKGGASGILCKGVGNVISHNLIHSTPRVGIWFDGNDHLIEYNHIHHVNQETQDSGMIYCSQIDWTKRGTIVQFNYLHDSGGYGRRSFIEAWQAPFDTYGIYIDDWSSGTKIYGNIVSNTEMGGIFIHSGRHNIIENNLIIEGGRLGQMVYSAWPSSSPTTQKWLPTMYSKVQEMGYKKYPLLASIKDVQTGALMSGNSFVRNIVYYTIKNSYPVLFGIYNDIDLATTTSDYNTIYHGGQSLLVPYMKTSDDLQWEKWKDSGLDKNSVIADPLFTNSASGGFQLSPDSPALKLGFKPIPFDKIGPYKDPRRASWPITELSPPGLFSVKEIK
jgi:parallel beta-helix repeat protein